MTRVVWLGCALKIWYRLVWRRAYFTVLHSSFSHVHGLDEVLEGLKLDTETGSRALEVIIKRFKDVSRWQHILCKFCNTRRIFYLLNDALSFLLAVINHLRMAYLLLGLNRQHNFPRRPPRLSISPPITRQARTPRILKPPLHLPLVAYLSQSIALPRRQS